MATDILVPTLGESVSEATVAQWLKKPGDSVARDEPLVELETDKVTLEVNAAEAGVLQEVLAGEGDNVEVGAILGRIGAGNGASESTPAAVPSSETRAPEPEPAPEPAASEEPAAAPAQEGTPETGGNPVDIVVPALGESVTEATVAKWLKASADSVARDEPLVELETDKVTLEVNAPEAGTLGEIQAEEGATVEVGAVLGVLMAGGTAAPSPSPAEAAPEPATEETPAAVKPTGSATPSPASQTPARPAFDPTLARRSGPGGKITSADLTAFVGESAIGNLGPAVRKLITEHNLDPFSIPASGRDGRITKEDVLNVIEGRVKPATPVAGPPFAAVAPSSGTTVAPAAGGREERVRMTKLRQTIARRLKEAQNTAAMLTTFNECDMSATMALRAQYKEAFEKKHGRKLGFMSFFTKAVVAALQEMPAVNARIEGDEIVYNHFYDIGMAVSTPNGLMVPVLRDCDKKSFAEIESTLADLAGKGRDGKLSMDEMTGGTFTITNGGVFGSMLSTPILNIPQSAILGLHKIQERPVAVNGAVEIRPMMYLALSYDHRIIDGREAVTFLVRVKENMEDPQRLLLDI